MKPRIIVLSPDDDDGFKWLSDGWNSVDNQSDTSRMLMARARECIKKGENVPEVIKLLTKAGFQITRDIGPATK